MNAASINFISDDLVCVVIKGQEQPPAEAARMLAEGEAWIGDVKYVVLRDHSLLGRGDTFKSFAKAWQIQNLDGKGQPEYHKPTGFRIGAGAYGDSTVLTCGEIGRAR